MLRNGTLFADLLTQPQANQTLSSPLLVVGGSTAAYSATLAALQGGGAVCLVQPQQIVGGQFTAQALPASDDGKLIAKRNGIGGESFAISRSYRRFRQRQRELQPINGRVVANPGGGWVSHLCVTPAVAAQALQEPLIDYLKQGKLIIITHAEPIAVLTKIEGQRRCITGVEFQRRGDKFTVDAQVVIEATDLGDLLELSGIESRVGQESRHDTGEAILPDRAFPLCQQAITFCAVVEKKPAEGVTIGKPSEYDRQPWLNIQDFTSTFWMHKDQNPPWKRQDFFDDFGIFTYRRIYRSHQSNAAQDGDITIINWGTSPRGDGDKPPRDAAVCCGNDYLWGVLVGVSREERQENIRRARDRTQAYLHWLQTNGINLKPRGDLTGTANGIALEPYIREARRGVALTTIRHEDIAQKFFPRAARARCFPDSVGIGQYHYIDFHPNNAPGHVDLGDGKATLPFTLPLGALIPTNTDGLILSAKSIGTTHITNAAYRMHPVEWAIGEASGYLAAFALEKECEVRRIATDPNLTRQLQDWLTQQGVPLCWFDDVGHDDPDFTAIQVLAVAGILPRERESLHFMPEAAVTRGAIATAVVKLVDLTLSYPPASPFQDVSPEHPAYTDIVALHQQGIVVGIGNHQFAPELACKRQHLAIIVRKLGFEPEQAFSGIPSSGHLTRRELARILYRLKNT
ncbi:MAG: FAD-dependent oxidoreductase [Cyanophyceae cyanobacterium]